MDPVKKTVTIKGIGHAYSGEEENVLVVDGKYHGIANLLEMADAEVLYWMTASAFELEHCKERFSDWKSYRTEYRAEEGREYPRAYRVKVSLELEELPEEEAVAYWKGRQHAHQEQDDE